MFHKQFRLEEQPHPANNKAPSADRSLMFSPHRLVEKSMGC